jgi:hypothetical protein
MANNLGCPILWVLVTLNLYKKPFQTTHDSGGGEACGLKELIDNFVKLIS